MTTIDPSAMLDALQTAIETYDGPAPAVLLEVTRGGLSAQAATGVLTVGQDAPATTDAKFHIASQTKMFTAAVVLQMAAEGHFSLDDRLSDVMDVAALSGIANIEEATLRQLLTHSSGIPDYVNDFIADTGVPVLWERLLETPPKQVGAAEAIEHLIAQAAPAEFAPGEGFEYSNTGFLLLQLAIEHVAGNPLGEEFQTRIFDPLGMDGSSFPGFGRPDGIISSYATLGDQLVDVTHLPIDDAGDGGIVSTTADMAKFMQALVLDRSLVPESQMDGLAQFFEAAGFGEGEFVGHSGNTVGTTSFSLVHTPSGTIISLALTHANEGGNLSDLFDAVVANIMTYSAWTDFQDLEGPLDLALTAAELGVSEDVGEDGLVRTQLDMQGVALSLEGGLADFQTDRLTFEDGSILFISDDHDTRFRVEQNSGAPSQADNQLIGRGGDDSLSGGHGNDRLSGHDGDDWLRGRGGDDHIQGNGGDDMIRGNAGNDALYAGGGNDNVKGGAGDDLVRGGGGADRLIGGSGADDLKGGRGDDTILGNGSADDIKGGAGDDVIIAGRGDDVMKGNAGSDIFKFRANDGSDTIRDFQQGQDLIKIVAGANGFDDLDIRQDGDDVLVKFAHVDITVLNARTEQFDESDFIF